MCNAFLHMVNSREGPRLNVFSYKAYKGLYATPGHTTRYPAETCLRCSKVYRGDEIYGQWGLGEQVQPCWAINAILQCSTSQQRVNRFNVARGH